MFGHGASLQDPYAALELFHGKFSTPIGTAAGNNRFSRYKNPEYDKLLDEMAPLGSDDPKFQADRRQGAGDLLARHDRHSGHPVAAPHPLQQDLLDQLAEREQSRRRAPTERSGPRPA